MQNKDELLFTEQELQHAAGELRDALLETLPPPDQCQHEFSPDFEKKMAETFRRRRAQIARRRALRWVACVALALLAGITIWLSADQQAWAGFTSWVRETYEHSVGLFSNHSSEEETAKTAPECHFGWLPEGYTADGWYADEEHRWFNAEIQPTHATGAAYTQRAYFNCQVNDVEWKTFLDYGEEYETRTVEIGNVLGELYVSTDGSQPNSLVWQEENGDLILFLTGLLPDDELIRIAQGVTLEWPDGKK